MESEEEEWRRGIREKGRRWKGRVRRRGERDGAGVGKEEGEEG